VMDGHRQVLDAMLEADELGVKRRMRLLDSTRLNGGLATWNSTKQNPVLHLMGMSVHVRAQVSIAHKCACPPFMRFALPTENQGNSSYLLRAARTEGST
jgi:hypothetical protein